MKLKNIILILASGVLVAAIYFCLTGASEADYNDRIHANYIGKLLAYISFGLIIGYGILVKKYKKLYTV